MAQAQAEKLFQGQLSLHDDEALAETPPGREMNPAMLQETIAAPLLQAASPLMAQYKSIKARHEDCLVFFRLGDFYELFFDDAVKASQALDIALTRRGQHQGQDIPMCGVPAHAYEAYLAKLIRRGFRVALCEQTETPSEAKKRGSKSLVNRDVVRIVTPGTLTEDSLLDARSANILASVAGLGDELALSWIDLSCGRPMTQDTSASALAPLLARLDASEIIISERLIERDDLRHSLLPWRDRMVAQPHGRFDRVNAERRLHTVYGVADLAAFGDFSRAEITALGSLLDYVELTQKGDLGHIARPDKVVGADVMAIDPSTKRNLELTRTLSGEREGSLLSRIDRTVTGAGARLLASHLVAPLLTITSIVKRQDAIDFALQNKLFRSDIRDCLRRVPDLERCLTRLCLGRGGPRDLASIRDALAEAQAIHAKVQAVSPRPDLWNEALEALNDHASLYAELARALASDLPYHAREGNFIAKGFAAELDELVTLRDDSRQLIAQLQKTYADRSEVNGLKVRHNNVMGYYIEVTSLHADKLLAMPDLFIHRQSLSTVARFTTVELGELERRIAEAADRALEFELKVFNELVAGITAKLIPLRKVALALSCLDVTCGLAELAAEHKYVRPLVDTTLAFEIEAGRHPVVEQALAMAEAGSAFIANDTDLAPGQRLWLMTGPNMAGKSTFLRQNALIALMAQMGSYVPARAAHIGVIDRLFSRVGASDDLARGQSTFMVEMVETAAILNQATDRSLVILDEIGRGTATYDGLSIAWAAIEHLHEVNRCRSLFATHYHELTRLSSRLGSLSCHTMRIKEWDNEVIFLHEVIDGVADRSYGIHVARMAGLPSTVIRRAEAVLAALETQESEKTTGRTETALALPSYADQRLNERPLPRSELDVLLATLEPDNLTPKEALAELYAIKALIAPR